MFASQPFTRAETFRLVLSDNHTIRRPRWMRRDRSGNDLYELLSK